MPIIYPRNLDSKYNLYRISTQEIIRRNVDYPDASGAEIPDIDPDYIWLEIKEGFEPQYDPRYFILLAEETPDLDVGEFQITYDTVKRPAEEIQLNAEDVETAANEEILPYNKQMKLIILGLAVLFRQTENQTLNAKETIIKNRVIAIGTKLWKNDATLRAKLNAIVAGQEPNLDDGWERQE